MNENGFDINKYLDFQVKIPENLEEQKMWFLELDNLRHYFQKKIKSCDSDNWTNDIVAIILKKFNEAFDKFISETAGNLDFVPMPYNINGNGKITRNPVKFSESKKETSRKTWPRVHWAFLLALKVDPDFIPGEHFKKSGFNSEKIQLIVPKHRDTYVVMLPSFQKVILVSDDGATFIIPWENWQDYAKLKVPQLTEMADNFINGSYGHTWVTKLVMQKKKTDNFEIIQSRWQNSLLWLLTNKPKKNPPKIQKTNTLIKKRPNMSIEEKATLIQQYQLENNGANPPRKHHLYNLVIADLVSGVANRKKEESGRFEEITHGRVVLKEEQEYFENATGICLDPEMRLQLRLKKMRYEYMVNLRKILVHMDYNNGATPPQKIYKNNKPLQTCYAGRKLMELRGYFKQGKFLNIAKIYLKNGVWLERDEHGEIVDPFLTLSKLDN